MQINAYKKKDWVFFVENKQPKPPRPGSFTNY